MRVSKILIGRNIISAESTEYITHVRSLHEVPCGRVVHDWDFGKLHVTIWCHSPGCAPLCTSSTGAVNTPFHRSETWTSNNIKAFRSAIALLSYKMFNTCSKMLTGWAHQRVLIRFRGKMRVVTLPEICGSQASAEKSGRSLHLYYGA